MIHERCTEEEENDPEVQRSLAALEAVKPEPLKFEDIEFNLGVRWMPVKYVENYARQLFEDDTITVDFSKNADTYVVSGGAWNNEKIRTEYAVMCENGTVNGLEIFYHALQDTTPEIKHVIGYNAEGKPRYGMAAT